MNKSWPTKKERERKRGERKRKKVVSDDPSFESCKSQHFFSVKCLKRIKMNINDAGITHF